MSIYPEHPVYVWRRGEVDVETYTVPAEEEFCIYVNGQLLTRLMASPGAREALVVGFLFYSRIIETPADMATLYFSEGESCADVWLTTDRTPLVEARLANPNVLHTSGCGRGVVLGDLYTPPEPLPVELTPLTPAWLLDMARLLQDATANNPHSHGVHTSMLFTPTGEVVAKMTDVGRHNTLDKLLGACLLGGRSTEGFVLVTTGRLSSEMISKAARMRVPIVASLRAVTSTAVELAEAWGITTVGYLRGQQMVVHTHPERLGIED
ncbi:MAG: formate dehydrogenase accessory sulfurtransferase FdhD [Anaerolineae bacterium]